MAAGQRGDVAAAVKELGARATVLTISDATYLHPSIVVRRLKELGLDVPGMDWQPERKTSAKQQEHVKRQTGRVIDESRKAASGQPPHGG